MCNKKKGSGKPLPCVLQGRQRWAELETQKMTLFFFFFGFVFSFDKCKVDSKLENLKLIYVIALDSKKSNMPVLKETQKISTQIYVFCYIV